MNKDCSIVRDLLPLYAEDMVAPETADFIAAHVAVCGECEKEYETVKSGATPSPDKTEAEKAPLKSIKKAIIRKRIQAVILTVVLVAALFASAFAFLTTREYLPYDEAIADITMYNGNFSADVAFTDRVTGYDYVFTKEPETGDQSPDGWVCLLEAWTTPWDRLSGHKPDVPATISRVSSEDDGGVRIIIMNSTQDPSAVPILVDSIDAEGNALWKVIAAEEAALSNAQANMLISASPFSLYYTPNDGTEDVYVAGPDGADAHSGAVRTLPRLTLNYYFYGAAALFALLIAAAFIFHRRETARNRLVRLAFLPLSYVAAHLIVKGFGGASYALMRDFTLILLIAVLLFCAMLVAHNIFLLKKEMKSV